MPLSSALDIPDDLPLAGPSELAAPRLIALPDRYQDRGLLGEGGVGEVSRVYDRDLDRVLALKTLKREWASHASVTARFLAEARVTARLQHPGVVPVHDIGQLPDGRWYFTMDVVVGRTLGEVIDEVQAAGSSAVTTSGWSLRRLVDAFLRICQTVAHAHGLGVVHRDLKPENVAVGPNGELRVLDWGLARGRGITAEDGTAIDDAGTEDAPPHRTRPGQVAGTPSYMSPEQASGQLDQVDERSDVYSLGAVLYEILGGVPPFDGPTAEIVLLKVQQGSPAPLAEIAPGKPEALIVLAERCLARDPADRPASAAEVASAVRTWLDGLRQREVAMGFVEEARRKASEAHVWRERADALRRTGEALNKGLPGWAPEEHKAQGWEKQDEADSLQREADRLDLEAEGLLLAAIAQAPDLAEAHAALAARYRASHAAAEARRDASAAAAAELRLRTHVMALPAAHPSRGFHLSWLRGDGAITVVTNPPGAEVWVERYELRRRRLIPVSLGLVGVTPLSRHPLARGSYRLRLRLPGRSEVLYPVHLDRCEHWHGQPPGGREPQPIVLPRLGELVQDDLLVPAGWFQFGGDAEAMGALPAAKLWLDAFVIRRYPVTMGEFIAFLDALVAEGREAEALRHAPRERAGTVGEEGALILGRSPDGRFVLRPDSDGDLWSPSWPAMMVDFEAAEAYAAWWSARTGRRWRLPSETEWEKAARGVDGRLRPWGDFLDPAWCNCRTARPDRPMPSDVTAFPVDESPYGVRGMAGNICDWTSSPARDDGPPIQRGRVLPDESADDEPNAPRVIRGGAYDFQPMVNRAAYRYSVTPMWRSGLLGFRLARTAS